MTGEQSLNKQLVQRIVDELEKKNLPIEIDATGCSPLLGVSDPDGGQIIMTVEPDAEYLLISLGAAIKSVMDTFR